MICPFSRFILASVYHICRLMKTTATHRFRGVTLIEPNAKVICFPGPRTIVAMGGIEAEGAGGIAIVNDPTSIDSPINSANPAIWWTIPNSTWNRCGP